MISVVNQGSGAGLTALEVMDIVRNEALYTKRIKELQECIKEAEAVTKQLTKAKDLDAALKSAKKAEESAHQTLIDAKAKAAQEIHNAEQTAEYIIARANQEVTKISEDIVLKQSELDSLNANVTLSTQHLNALREEIDEANARLKARKEEHSALVEEISSKRKAFESLLGK